MYCKWKWENDNNQLGDNIFMTMPKGWRQPEKKEELTPMNSVVANPLLPPASQLLRPMIGSMT